MLLSVEQLKSGTQLRSKDHNMALNGTRLNGVMGTDLGSKAEVRVDDESRRVREDLQVAEVVKRPELRRHEALNTFGELKGQDGVISRLPFGR